MDFLICQTVAASPAKPGELPFWFRQLRTFVRSTVELVRVSTDNTYDCGFYQNPQIEKQ
jgi:hypothetical protein